MTKISQCGSWALCDPGFFVPYLWFVAGGFVAVMVLLWLLIPRGRPIGDRPPPYVIAYPIAGPATVLVVAVTRLRAAGIVALTDAKQLRVAADLPAGSHVVDAEIVRVLRSRSLPFLALWQDPELRATLLYVGTQARDAGVLMPRVRRLGMIFVTFGIPSCLFAVGVAKLITDYRAGYFDSWLMVAVTFLVVVPMLLVWVLFTENQKSTHAGRRFLRRLRQEFQHPHQQTKAIRAEPEAELAALRVSLFGPGVLATLDPALAAAIGDRFLRRAAGTIYVARLSGRDDEREAR